MSILPHYLSSGVRLPKVWIQRRPRGPASQWKTRLLQHVKKLVTHEVHEDHEVFNNLIPLCVLRALRGDILFRMLCPSKFRDEFSLLVFAQSPSPDWVKQIFSANSASLRLLLNLFTAEAQRTPREGFFVCRETTTNKKTPPSGRKARWLTPSWKLDLRNDDNKVAKKIS